MRVAYDVTSLLDRRTGVGAFTGEVLTRIATVADLDVVGYSVSWRGRARAGELLPSTVRRARGPMAAQPLRQLWRRTDWPPIEWWTGAVDLVHGPNFMVPPAKGGTIELATVHDLTCVRFPELCTRDTLHYPDLIRRALQRGAHIHAVSQFVADEVVQTFAVESDRVHVVPNGIDPVQQGDAAAGRARVAADRYVLAVGTIEPRKDLPLLVDAFDHVARTREDVSLVVAGQDGWGSDAFTAAVARATPRRSRRPDRLGRRPRSRRPVGGRPGPRLSVQVRGLRPRSAGSHGRRDTGRRDARGCAPRNPRRRRSARLTRRHRRLGHGARVVARRCRRA